MSPLMTPTAAMTPMQIAGVAAPELFLSGAALLLLLWGAFKARAGGVFTAAAVVALCAAAVVACVAPLGRAFMGGLILDQGAVYAKVVIYLASACAIPLGERWFAKRGEPRFEFPVLVIIAGLGMGMMVSAGDLISLFISVELQSLALYILAAFERNDGRSSEAGLKYFVLGSLSSGIMLYGASLVYGFAGSTRFDEIALAMSHGAGGGALLGLVFLICGLAFKVSAAPFHMWSPDVYEGAPTPVVGFLVGAPKLAAMVLLARLLTEGFGGAVMQWRQIIVVMAILSVGVGAYAGLRQSNLKRLWAYASIANIGYAMVGLAAGGAIGVQAMLIFMTLYVIDVTGFFACLAALSRDGRPMQTLGDFAGLARERPGLATAITFFSLSGLGLPPFSGLWSKFYVFKAAIVSGLAPVAVIALVGSVIAAYYYLRLIKVMWLDPSAGRTDAPPADATIIGFAAALFSLPVVWFALIRLDPLAQAAAAAIIRP
jgi:NADH-quinone oxidoreductase subunit N